MDQLVKYNNMDIQPKDTSKWHFRISLVKSLIRIVAGMLLTSIAFYPLDATMLTYSAGICLIIAELLGIAEELA